MPNQGSLLRQSIDEHYFHAALMAVNELPDDPSFVWTLAHDHRWLGLDVPGSRFGQDNPDNCYRLAAIDPAHAYRIAGKYPESPSCDFSICALAEQPGEGVLANTTAVITRDTIDLGMTTRFRSWLMRLQPRAAATT